MDVFVSALLAALLVALAAGVFPVFLYRPILKGVTGFVLRLLLTESYAKNMWEFVSSVRRFKPLKIAEGGLRAEYGEILSRPLGTPKKLAGFEGLIFLPAQLATLTTRETHKVDTRTVIGPQAKRPLRLEIPLLISGMGAGVPLTEPVKIALAKGASLAGTATNTGQGPLLPEERKAADKLILQYSSRSLGQNIGGTETGGHGGNRRGRGRRRGFPPGDSLAPAFRTAAMLMGLIPMKMRGLAPAFRGWIIPTTGRSW